MEVILVRDLCFSTRWKMLIKKNIQENSVNNWIAFKVKSPKKPDRRIRIETEYMMIEFCFLVFICD